MSPRQTHPATPAPATGGIAATDVDRAADSLLRAGQRPTIERVRAHIGRGSPNTINPLLDAWWSRLAGRLDAGPAALHRLPEPVLLAAEGLWLRTLDEARKRAAHEQGRSKSVIARDRQELEVRSHVLSIRESELTARIEQSERRATHLEREVATLTTLLRKEQASRLAAEHRLVDRAPRKKRGRGGRAQRTPAAGHARVRARGKARAMAQNKARRNVRKKAPKKARKKARKKATSPAKSRTTTTRSTRTPTPRPRTSKVKRT